MLSRSLASRTLSVISSAKILAWFVFTLAVFAAATTTIATLAACHLDDALEHIYQCHGNDAQHHNRLYESRCCHNNLKPKDSDHPGHLVEDEGHQPCHTSGVENLEYHPLGSRLAPDGCKCCDTWEIKQDE